MHAHEAAVRGLVVLLLERHRSSPLLSFGLICASTGFARLLLVEVRQSSAEWIADRLRVPVGDLADAALSTAALRCDLGLSQTPR